MKKKVGKTKLKTKPCRIERRRLLKEKRGSIFDVIFATVMLTVAVVAAFIGTKVWSEINKTDLFNTTEESRQVGVTFTERVIPLFDYWIFMGWVGAFAGVSILAFLSRFRPLFLPFSILLALLAVYLSIVIANVYEEIKTDPQLAAELEGQYPLSDSIFMRLPLVTTIFCTLVIITMYALSREESF